MARNRAKGSGFGKFGAFACLIRRYSCEIKEGKTSVKFRVFQLALVEEAGNDIQDNFTNGHLLYIVPNRAVTP